MELAKKQLRAYYKEQGLEGHKLATAVWQDLCRFKRNVKAYCKRLGLTQEDYGAHLNASIAGGFAWQESPEGQQYWGYRHMIIYAC